MVFAAVAACGSEPDPIDFESSLVSHINRSPIFSAYDGVHEYSFPLNVPGADNNSPVDANPILASSIRWQVDDDFVSVSEIPGQPDAIKLTTKKAGKTTVTMFAKHRVGPTFRGEARLVITQGTPEDWEAGDARFEQGPRISPADAFMESDAGPCGLAEEIGYPNTVACISCHDQRSLRSALSPLIIGGHSDNDLIEIITEGARPSDVYVSDYLLTLRMPDCVYRAIHSYDLSDKEKRGIVLKLRSLPLGAWPE